MTRRELKDAAWGCAPFFIVLVTLVLILAWMVWHCARPGVQMETVDGCDYIKSRVYAGWNYTHAGSCKNPIHQR